MATIKYPMTLSTTEPYNYVGKIKVRQADDNTQIFQVTVTENGQPKSFAGLTPFFCLLPGEVTGQGVSEEPVTSYNASAGTLEYTLSPNALQFARVNEAYFSFRKELPNGKWIEQFSTKSFFYTVEKSIYTQPFKDSNYWFTFSELYRKFQMFIEQNREIIESIDPGGMLLSRIGIFNNFREWDYTVIEKMANEFTERGVNVKWFGAKCDGITDDTVAIQSAIEFAVKNRLNIYFPDDSEILISKQGEWEMDTWTTGFVRDYAFFVENAENIKFTGNSTFKYDLSKGLNLFVFKDCKNLDISGLKLNNDFCENEEQQYKKTLITLVRCEKVLCSNLFSKNGGSVVDAIRCNGITISNCLGCISNVSLITGAHFRIAGCSNIIIENCKCYGGTKDGDLIIYNSAKAFIRNCILYNSYLEDTLSEDGKVRFPPITDFKIAQGICIDAGCYNVTVDTNYVYGYCMGIDVKTQCFGTIVTNNHVVCCQNGITSRYGEAKQDMPEIIISNNIISVNGGNGRAGTNVGVFIERTYSFNITNNKICNDPFFNKQVDFVGIQLTGDGDISQNLIGQRLICNNEISGKNTYANYQSNSAKSAIVLKNASRVVLKENFFKGWENKNAEYQIVIQNCSNITIDGGIVAPYTNGKYISILDSKRIILKKINISPSAFLDAIGILMDNVKNIVIDSIDVWSNNGETTFSFEKSEKITIVNCVFNSEGVGRFARFAESDYLIVKNCVSFSQDRSEDWFLGSNVKEMSKFVSIGNSYI